MRHVSSKFAKQESDSQDSFPESNSQVTGQAERAGVEKPNLEVQNSEQSLEKKSEDPLNELASSDAGNPTVSFADEKRVDELDDFSLAADEKETSNVSQMPPSPPLESANLFGPEYFWYWVGGGILLMIGALGLLSRLARKKNLDHYRAPVAEVDPQKELRGQFKPAQRFLKPKENSEELASQAGVSNLVASQGGPAEQEQAFSDEEEFDFSADLAEGEFELFESNELGEAKPKAAEVSSTSEVSSEVEAPKPVGSLSARPPEPHQDGELSFVEPAGSPNAHFVHSTVAQFASSELEYSGDSTLGFRDEDFSVDDELFEDSELDMEGVLREDDLSLDAAAESDNELELEIQASESARDFGDESTDDHPVRAISEDEEAVMNLRDDDSELELEFDLGDDSEVRDSDPDFDFELDVDDSLDDSSTEFAGVEVAEPPVQTVSVEDEPVLTAVDDSGEFADLLEASSDDLESEFDIESPDFEGPDLEGAAVAPAVNEIEDVVETSFPELDAMEGMDDSVGELASNAGEAAGSAVGDVAGGVVDAVGQAVGNLGDTAGAAVDSVTDGVADAADGLSTAAKATVVAAGTAGAAAGGGFLATLFGWGKKNDVAAATESVVEESVQDAAELVDGAVEQVADVDLNGLAEASQEVGIAGSEAGEAIFDLDTDDALSFQDDAELELGDAASDEFDFKLDDDGPEAVAVAAADSAIEILEDQEVVETTNAAATDAPELVADDVELVDQNDLEGDDVFDFDLEDDVDLAQTENIDAFSLSDTDLAGEAEMEKSFSSMDTLREPEPAVEIAGEPAVQESGFSSADTIREPIVETETEPEPEEELGGAALAGTVGAGAAAAAAAVGLNTSTDPVEEEADLDAELDVNFGEADQVEAIPAGADTSELEARIAELEQANQSLEESARTAEEFAKTAEESAKSLEEKLEASVAESQQALQQAEKEHNAKLEEAMSENSKLTELESELESELEAVKAELAEAKTSAEAAKQKDTDLMKLQTELESAQTSKKALDDELESLKKQLEAAVADQSGGDAMPTGSLTAAAGLGAAGLAGAAGLVSGGDTTPPADSAAFDDLKKRFEGRLKAERRARKDAQSQLAQAEEQRNDIARTLKKFKKEMAESPSVESTAKPAADNSAQITALKSKLEDQFGRLKALESEKTELSKSVEELKKKNAELESRAEKADQLQAELDDSSAKTKRQSGDA